MIILRLLYTFYKMRRKIASVERKSTWEVYILGCGDGSLYTGMTNDLDRRLNAHRKGTASRYTRSRLPVKLLYREEAGGRSAALKREAEIKKMSRTEKISMIGFSRSSGR